MLSWLWLLPLGVQCSCNLADMHIPNDAYKPAADVQPPFDCSGQTVMDLTHRGLRFLDNTTFNLDSCKHVEKIYLSCNDFTTIGNGSFNGLSLQILYLSSNPSLATISTGAFNGLIVHLQLHLNINPSLVSINTGAFYGLIVGVLDLRNNRLLATVTPGAFNGLNVHTLWLSYNPSLRLDTLGGVLSPLTMLNQLYLASSGITVVPVGLFANLTDQLMNLNMANNPSQCTLDESKVTCKCATSYFDHSQQLSGGDDGNCICLAGQYTKFGMCQQCPPNTYSNKPNEHQNCTACSDKYISNVGSTNASDCHIDPVIQAQQETLKAQQETLKAQQQAINASAAQLQAQQEARLQAERANNATAENLRLEQERNDAQERENLITIFSAIVVVLVMVIGGAWLYYFHKKNLALTKQLNEGLQARVSEQHEEIAYLRDWR